MDKIISNLDYVEFGELNYVYDNIMYQRDTDASVPYDKDYFQKYVSYENTNISVKLNSFRTEITQKYCKSILDIGIGSGEFVKKSKIKTFGYDINPYGINWLKENSKFVNPYEDNLDQIEGVCFWDSLEHIPEPSNLLEKLVGKYVFISIPIFDNLLEVRKNKHYRPNEHYYYYTALGLISYMGLMGFNLKEISDREIQAGREGIYTFVFN